MANENHSKWYYLSGTVYYVFKILAILGAAALSAYAFYEKFLKKEPIVVVTPSSVPTPVSSVAEIEAALNRWLIHRSMDHLPDLCQKLGLSEQMEVKVVLEDGSFSKEGSLKGYLMGFMSKTDEHLPDLHIKSMSAGLLILEEQ